jgi:hypothetical protein
MIELQKRPWHYARDYMQANDNRKAALQMGIKAAADRHKSSMQEIWDSIPPHLLDMVKSHINSTRDKEMIK